MEHISKDLTRPQYLESSVQDDSVDDNARTIDTSEMWEHIQNK